MGFRNKHGNRVPAKSIEYILHNLVYTGKYYFEGVLREDNDYPPLISEATYYAVQEKLNAPEKTRQTSPARSLNRRRMTIKRFSVPKSAKAAILKRQPCAPAACNAAAMVPPEHNAGNSPSKEQNKTIQKRKTNQINTIGP